MRKRGQWINRQHLFKRCSKGHPHITVSPDVMDGLPHLSDTIIPVSLILARVRAYGSIQAVMESHPGISREQIEEALSYAQTFLEIACDTNQPQN